MIDQSSEELFLKQIEDKLNDSISLIIEKRNQYKKKILDNLNKKLEKLRRKLLKKYSKSYRIAYIGQSIEEMQRQNEQKAEQIEDRIEYQIEFYKEKTESKINKSITKFNDKCQLQINKLKKKYQEKIFSIYETRIKEKFTNEQLISEINEIKSKNQELENRLKEKSKLEDDIRQIIEEKTELEQNLAKYREKLKVNEDKVKKQLKMLKQLKTTKKTDQSKMIELRNTMINKVKNLKNQINQSETIKNQMLSQLDNLKDQLKEKEEQETEQKPNETLAFESILIELSNNNLNLTREEQISKLKDLAEQYSLMSDISEKEFTYNHIIKLIFNSFQRESLNQKEMKHLLNITQKIQEQSRVILNQLNNGMIILKDIGAITKNLCRENYKLIETNFLAELLKQAYPKMNF
jgi:chromosome segregation protein